MHNDIERAIQAFKTNMNRSVRVEHLEAVLTECNEGIEAIWYELSDSECLELDTLEGLSSLLQHQAI